MVSFNRQTESCNESAPLKPNRTIPYRLLKLNEIPSKRHSDNARAPPQLHRTRTQTQLKQERLQRH